MGDTLDNVNFRDLLETILSENETENADLFAEYGEWINDLELDFFADDFECYK
jgi:hypothetical protein